MDDHGDEQCAGTGAVAAGFVDVQVAFAWKDYRHEWRRKVLRLGAQEFVCRFLLHVLPTGFQRHS
ncbi:MULTISPECIES: transposase [unclassified Variovorax]|nr:MULTISPECIES: transposase [unclassified Variovorax]